MKRLFLLVATVMLAATATAQEITAGINNRHIEVIGTHEITLTPDIFYVAITIDESDSKGRKSAIEQQEEMISELKKLGIDIAKQLKMHTLGSTFEKRTKAYSSIDYSLKLTSETELTRVLQILDALYISNVRLERTESSQMEQARKEARREAILNAKSVAEELAEAIGEKVGYCKSIIDQSNDNRPIYGGGMLRSFSRAMDANSLESSTKLELTDINVSYRVRATFSLK